MKNTIQTILTLLTLVPTIAKGQKDSIEVFRLNDNYIEIKSLRHVLSIDSFSMTPTMSLFTYSLIPKPPKIKEGVILIRDRQDNMLKLYIYSDSSIIQEDHYYKGKLSKQFSYESKDSVEVQKYYWDNGTLSDLVIYWNRKQTTYSYSKDGRLIIGQGE
jgi:hypothetical protein